MKLIFLAWTWVMVIFLLDFFETLSGCVWAFQSIMSPTTQLPRAGDFQDRKRISGRKYISCQLPAVAFNFLSCRSGKPIKTDAWQQM